VGLIPPVGRHAALLPVLRAMAGLSFAACRAAVETLSRGAKGSAMTEPKPTRIYVDADACPVKDEIYRVAARFGLPVSVVANSFIRVPRDPLIERIAVGADLDAADN
jgi:hypothetical protein